jgi:V8-like Glu-specific endopeptidase
MGTATESSSYTIAKPSARTYIGRNCTTGENTIYSTTGTSGLSTCDMVDNRVVDNSEDSSSIVQLSVGGTGFIVDKHIIATAAHCLYSKDSGFIDNIDVNIYADDGVTKLATFDAKEIHIPYQYKYRITNDVDDSDCYDYGLIYVEEDLSNYGIMGIGTISNEFLESKATLGLSGFPAEVNSTDVNCKIRYVSYGTSDQDTSSNYAKIYKIKLVASASGGDSGGPMFIEKEFLGKKYRTAVGIFTAGVDNNMYGTRITPTLVQFLRNSYVGTL